MLHAALIGFPSSGKSTLFQLMTSAKDAPRGKGDVAIGISKVPDARLDVLTGMYNPRKRVPATVEFTDIIAPARTGAQALVEADLVDELHLMVFPVVLGTGRRLFGETSEKSDWRLTEAKAVGPDGVIVLIYERAR